MQFSLIQSLVRPLALAAAALGLAGIAASAEPARRPNVIFLVADDLGSADLGVQGSPDIATPNIDAIAKAGTRFTNAYVSCPVCSPTRAGMLTGRYQQRFGHELNPGPNTPANFGLPKTERTIANEFADAGYATAVIGKWHQGNRRGLLPNERGFEYFYGVLDGTHPYLTKAPQLSATPRPVAVFRNRTIVDEPRHLTKVFGEEAEGFIDRSVKANRPFFLYFAPNAPHGPLQTDPEQPDRFPAITGPRNGYANLIAGLDDAIGRITAKLKSAGVENDTLIVFLSDNGGPKVTGAGNGIFSGYKGSVYEGGVHVPFFVKWTGHLPEGRVTDQPVISLDLFPTALAAAGVSRQGALPLDGQNLLPVLRQETAAGPHQYLFWRYEGQWAVRDGQYKLLVSRDGPRDARRAETRDGTRESTPRLYDLQADPGEANDLAAQKPDVVRRLRAAYAAWDADNIPPAWDNNSPRATESENPPPPPPDASATRPKGTPADS